MSKLLNHDDRCCFYKSQLIKNSEQNLKDYDKNLLPLIMNSDTDNEIIDFGIEKSGIDDNNNLKVPKDRDIKSESE